MSVGARVEGFAAVPRVPPRQLRLRAALASAVGGGERTFAVVGLFLFTSALVPLLLKEGGGSVEDLSQGNPVLRAMFSAVHALTLLLVAVRWREALRAALRHLPTLALLGMAVLSVAWSDAPDITLRRSFALVGTTAFGVYLAARFDVRGQLALLGSALGAAAVLSVAFAVALPAYGVTQEIHEGAWRGVFTQKNTLGQVMTLGALALVLLAASTGRRLAWGAAALCAALVLLSTSTTAAAVLGSMLALLLLYRALRLRPSRMMVVLSLAGLLAGGVGLWTATNTETVFALVGKDATLTGRTTLWDAVGARIAERPWVGHGYSAFWLGWGGASSAVLEAVGWETPHAHNGFLDLLLDLGVVGLALYAAGYALAAARAVAALRATRTAEGLWPLAFLTLVLLYNLTESVILRQNSVFWVLYVSTVSSSLLERRT